MFVSWRAGGTSEIYSVRTDGRGLAQLTFAGAAGSPQPSPNGRLVVVGPPPNPNILAHPCLLVLTPTGRTVASLADCCAGAWAPDSRSFVVPGPNGLELMRLGTSASRSLGPLTHGPDANPAWSPSGRALAFVRIVDYSDPVFHDQVIVLRRGRETVLATIGSVTGGLGDEAQHVPIAWSPDGRFLAVGTAVDTEVLDSFAAAPPRVVAAGSQAFAWSPRGDALAVSGDNGVELVKPDGAVRTLTPTRLNSLVWRDAIYGADGSRVLRLDPSTGQATTLYSGVVGEEVSDVHWWTPPHSAHLRGALPATATAALQAAPDELDSAQRITALAADGDSVLAVVGCALSGVGFNSRAFVVWRAGATSFTVPRSCIDPDGQGFSVDSVALGNGTPAAISGEGGISTAILWFALGHTTIRAAATIGCCVDELHREPLGYILAQGDTFVFSTSETCDTRTDRGCTGDRPPDYTGSERLAAQHIFRIDGTRPTEILSGPGEHAPLALDAGRIAVRTHATALDLIDLDGHDLLSIPVGAPVLQAALAQNDLIVLVPGALRVYNADTGDLTHSWPLPAAVVGTCKFSITSCTPDVNLIGTASGRAAYLLHGKVYIVRLSDGATAETVDAALAQLTSAGLFFSFVGAAPWPGRIRFIPANELPLTPEPIQ
jgi:hypothetical protein